MLTKIYQKISLYFSIALIPVGANHNFLDLQYKKIKPNTVALGQTIKIDVNKSASPLFYKMDRAQKIETITVAGSIEIKKLGLDPDQEDTQFQLGIVYAGDYRPGKFVRAFLPEWILKVIDLNKDYGLSEIDFHEAMLSKRLYEKSESIRDIKLNFKSAGYFTNDKFQMEIKPKDKDILGLWLRADGDDSNSEFSITIDQLNLKPKAN